jgi:hypothetical protein
MILIDKTGWYRLDAVAAVTPFDVRNFHTADKLKPHPEPPVMRTVAVLHLVTGGAGFVTDTDMADVLKMLGESKS